VGLVGGLAVVALGVGLPGLVEGLEEERVDAPVESAAAVGSQFAVVVVELSTFKTFRRETYTASW